MELKLKGTLSQSMKIEKGVSKAGKEWKKKTFVIDTGDEYNPNVAFTLFGDEKIALIKGMKKGDEIEVDFNLTSREFDGKWYHNINAWRVKALESETTTSDPIEDSLDPDEVDDLPF